MAYGVYSEVYYAVSKNNPNIFKVGETTNSRRREAQLFKKEQLIIPYWREVGGTKATRLFIESYLRLKIQNFTFVQEEKLDYFVCENTAQVEQLAQLFNQFVDEALQIISKNF